MHVFLVIDWCLKIYIKSDVVKRSLLHFLKPMKNDKKHWLIGKNISHKTRFGTNDCELYIAIYRLYNEGYWDLTFTPSDFTQHTHISIKANYIVLKKIINY